MTLLVDPHEYRARVFAWAADQGLETIRLSIYQPRDGGAKEWTCTLDELEAFARELHLKADRVRVAEAQHKAKPFDEWWPIYLNPEPNEQDCMFCRAQPLCPSKQSKLQRAAQADFGAIAEDPAATPDPKTYSIVDLNAAMKVVGEMEDWCKAVRAEAERQLLAGVELADFGLELGRQGNREFKDPEAAEKFLLNHLRLPHRHVYRYKLRSPAQLEKLLKPSKDPLSGEPIEAQIGPRQWKKVEEHVMRADAKPSVKPRSVIKTPYIPPRPDVTGFEAVPDDGDDLA